MDVKYEDRRVRRTKKLLKQGLSELMKEKDLKDISIKDITERVDLNRGTFYLHYTDIYDLLEKIEEDIISDFQSMIDAHRPSAGKKSLMPIIEPIGNYIAENVDICKILFSNKSNTNFPDKFKQLVYKNGYIFVSEKYKNASPSLMNYFFSFITYGIIGLINQYLNSSETTDIGKIINLCDRIISHSAESVFE